jgi:hypothetical protein
MSNLREEAIEHLSAKYNIPKSEVLKIVRSQFLFARKRCSELKETLIQYYGTMVLTNKGNRILNGDLPGKEEFTYKPKEDETGTTEEL